MDIALIIFGIGALVFLAHLFSIMFEKFHIPDVLFLVAIGLFLGPVTGLIDITGPGIVGEVFVLLTLLIILFEAGLDIKLPGLFSAAPRGLLFMFLTLFSTILVVMVFGSVVFDFTWAESLLIGTLLGGVSAGIAIPLLEKLPVEDRTKSLITFESNINDVFTISLVLAIIEFTNSGFVDVRSFSAGISLDVAVALLVGVTTAVLWSHLISRVRNVQNNIFMTPALVMMVFGVAELLGASGLFAALAFGITLGNLQYLGRRFPSMASFQEFFLTKWEKRMFGGFVFLLKTYFFVYLGLSIGIDDWMVLVWALVVTVLLFIARALIVRWFASPETVPFDRRVLQRLMPKGLVGAALITLVENDIAQDFTFGVVLWSIILTSLLIFLTKPAVTEEEDQRVRPMQRVPLARAGESDPAARSRIFD